MCGIVGAIAQRDVAPILLDSLKRLEYRGYDSAGMAVLHPENLTIQRIRALGKVSQLAEAMTTQSSSGFIGIAHTRWATHGKPSEVNAHPHLSTDDIALVHNGIIENYANLREQLIALGYGFASETDTEVAAHTIHKHLAKNDLLHAVYQATKELQGAYALGIISPKFPNQLIAVRRGSPLVIGLGSNEFFIASDTMALLPVAQRFIFLEEGDIASISRNGVEIYDKDLHLVERPIHMIDIKQDTAERGEYRHYMEKEIFEQPQVISDTLEGRIANERLLEQSFGVNASELFDKIKRVHIVACGTSYHAGLVGQFWIESLSKIPCTVSVASEYRYRHTVVEPDTLFVTLSQSGETADTLAALRKAKSLNYLATLGICNVAESSLVRESELVFMTRAGIEIGVASTKAFTTQLTSLILLSVALARRHGLTNTEENKIIHALEQLPKTLEQALESAPEIKKLASRFADKEHALFLGRGAQYPIAMEGALKLKEISYIHAEAYPAGELKHGPLALVDKNMPIVAVAPKDELLEKLQSNLSEVQARGGELIIFAEKNTHLSNSKDSTVIYLPEVHSILAPILYTIPLQLLAYHVAVIKGTDVDQPRNLAKSVTVE
ncbi:MAG: glutamine--fructose-6-phosphate transaminase (isomerizing) [Gammaproteobacteria bacterium]|nr:glutamine--fructose-6-phosphate transaminase (isomerizing) [Gammaproteobacteria bacterium]